jgi:uncharacterized protein
MRFICDTMLGRLAKYLRILGLDTIYVRSMSDLNGYEADIETPYFFTKRKIQKTSYANSHYIKADDVVGQLKEIKEIILPHILESTLMTRCLRCNAILRDVDKDDVESFVPEFVFHRYVAFKLCPTCNKVYWGGSHIDHMNEWVKEMTESMGEAK